MPRRRRRSVLTALLGLAAAALVLAGCGSSRIKVPDLSKVAPPYGFRTLQYPQAGVSLEAPTDWAVAPGRGSLLMVAASGPAVISLWHYKASATPPQGPTALGRARDALLTAARRHQPGLQVIRSALVSVGGHGAVELDTLQALSSRPRRLRSLHVYLPGEELVLEEYAPPSLFHQVDHIAFSPVKRSLRPLPSA